MSLSFLPRLNLRPSTATMVLAIILTCQLMIVLDASIVITALPEILRMAPTWRMVIYGLLLLVIVIRWPDGVGGVLRRRAPAS